MAILIKGMEMPDSCFLCRFCRRQEYGEYVGEDTAWSCVASKKRITDGQDLIATFKHPDCPLVEAAEVKDAVSRQAAIDTRRYTFGNDEFSLEDAYHDCKLVFDGITDDDSFLEADTGLILYYANEIIYALQEALEGKDTNVPTNDCISRKDAIDALWGERKKLDSYMDECLKKGLFALRSGTKAERNRIEEDIEIITRLPPAQSEQRWIPCTPDTMPKKPEQVMIYAWNVHYVLAKYREIRTWEGIYKMAWVVEDAYHAPFEIKHDVIAWMPLPEPYKPPTRSQYRRMQEQKGEQDV